MEEPIINKQLEQDDKRYIWHPFTQMMDYERETPLIIDRGEGSFLIDIYGNRYLDGVSSLWVNLHGHRREEMDNAIKEQLEKIAHTTLLGLSNTPAIKLAKKLVEISPQGLKKVFFSDNGSTAVEVGLKMAFQYWQHIGQNKTKFISFRNAYHGDTIGSVSVGGIDTFHKIFSPLLFQTYRSLSPYCYRCPLDKSYPSCGLSCLEELEELMEIHGDEVAALIIEPVVQAAAGMIVFPPGFLKGVRELCSKYHILIIADEVATGFGRTGRMFACEHEEVSPDIMALAKGITGGYLPLAVTLTTEEIYRAFLGKFEELKTFFHGHTYTGNPLACAAALASLEIFEKEKTLDKVQHKALYLESFLSPIKDLPHVGDVRHKGLMVGIELVMDKEEKRPFPIKEKIGIKVMHEARRRGLVIRPLGDVIVLMPPLSISKSELKKMVDITSEAIEVVTT